MCAAFSGSVAVAISPSSRRRRPQASQCRFLTCARNHRRCVRFAPASFRSAPSSSDRLATHTGWMHELLCCLSPRHSAPPWLHACSASASAVQITLPPGNQCHPHVDIDLDLPTYCIPPACLMLRSWSNTQNISLFRYLVALQVNDSIYIGYLLQQQDSKENYFCKWVYRRGCSCLGCAFQINQNRSHI